MVIQFIRHATFVLYISNKIILVDPMLSDKGSLPPVPFTGNKANNPMIPLPFPAEDIAGKINAVLVTHYHFDHFDEKAASLISKGIPVFCQACDAGKLKKKGFTNIKAVENELEWEGIRINRFPANHARGFLLNKILGNSSSYSISAASESIFITGDAVYDDLLKKSLHDSRPDVIIANTGEARMIIGEPITLRKEELKEIGISIPNSAIVAVHMDAINHCGLTKASLAGFIEKEGLQKKILVPAEGEKINFK